MSGIQNFGLLLQTLIIEHQRYREVRAHGEDDAKRRMYALEKRHKSGEALHPSDLLFLLNLQDKYGRPPAVPDKEPVVLPLQVRIAQSIAEEQAKEENEAKQKANQKAGKPCTPTPGAEILSTVFCSAVLSAIIILAAVLVGIGLPTSAKVALSVAIAMLMACASATSEVESESKP